MVTLLPETIQPAKRHKQNGHKQSQPATREVGSPLWGLMSSEVLIKKKHSSTPYSAFRVKLSLHRNPTFHLASSAPEPGPLAYFHTSTSMPLSEEERPNWLFGFSTRRETKAVK